MPAIEPFCRLFGIHPSTFSKKENLMIEAELLIHICENLKEYFKTQQKNYFCLMKLTVEMENKMLEENFIRFIIEDILLTKEYTPQGVASYIDSHEDVIHEILAGRNRNPSATLMRRSIELHRSVRPHLYQAIIKKIATQYLAMLEMKTLESGHKGA